MGPAAGRRTSSFPATNMADFCASVSRQCLDPGGTETYAFSSVDNASTDDSVEVAK